MPTPELDRAFEDFYRQHPELRGDGSTVVENAFVIGVVSILVVMFARLAVLALLVLRGSRSARVATWVLGGVIVLGQACALLGVITAPALLSSAAATGTRRARSPRTSCGS